MRTEKTIQYVAPEVEFLEVLVEQGFASSGNIEIPGVDNEEGM